MVIIIGLIISFLSDLLVEEEEEEYLFYERKYDTYISDKDVLIKVYKRDDGRYYADLFTYNDEKHDYSLNRHLSHAYNNAEECVEKTKNHVMILFSR